MSGVWRCDTPDQARTYATEAEADAEAARIRRGRTGVVVVVWFSGDEEGAA